MEIARSLARDGARVIVNGLSKSSVDSGISSLRAVQPTAQLEPLVSDNLKEIGDFVAFVSSPLASAINGAALRVDGGLVRGVF